MTNTRWVELQLRWRDHAASGEGACPGVALLPCSGPSYYTRSAVKISIQDIREVPVVVTFTEDATDLNAMLQHGVRDYLASSPVGVSVSYYRAGMDIFVDGEFWADLQGTCSRCLTQYPFRLSKDFALVLVPASELGPGGDDRSSRELHAEDLALSHYQGEEIDLSPLVLEQMILALPTRPLCDAACRGLCPQCGASLNAGNCGCEADRGNPRLAVLRNLKIGG